MVRVSVLIPCLLLAGVASAQSRAPSSKDAKPLSETKLDWKKLAGEDPVTYACVDAKGKKRAERLRLTTSFKKGEVKFVDSFSGFGATVATQTSYAKAKSLRLRKVIYTETSGRETLKKIEFFVKHDGHQARRLVHVFNREKVDPPQEGKAAWPTGVVSGYGLLRVVRLLPKDEGKSWRARWSHEFGDANAVSGYVIECVGQTEAMVRGKRKTCTLFRCWSRRQARFSPRTEPLDPKLKLRAELWVGKGGHVERLRLRAPHGFWELPFVRQLD